MNGTDLVDKYNAKLKELKTIQMELHSLDIQMTMHFEGFYMKHGVIKLIHCLIEQEESLDVNSRNWDKLETLYGLLRNVAKL